jgi:hypothetical protein
MATITEIKAAFVAKLLSLDNNMATEKDLKDTVDDFVDGITANTSEYLKGLSGYADDDSLALVPDGAGGFKWSAVLQP